MRLSTIAAVLAAASLSLTACTDSGQAGSAQFDRPEDAAQAFLRSIGRGDANGACLTMAAGGKVVEKEPQAMSMCVSAMTQVSQSARSALGPELQGATVSGVKVAGSSADFSEATVTPAGAESILRTMKGTRIGGSWYVTG